MSYRNGRQPGQDRGHFLITFQDGGTVLGGASEVNVIPAGAVTISATTGVATIDVTHGGAAETLAQTLVLGSLTGGTDINVSTGDSVRGVAELDLQAAGAITIGTDAVDQTITLGSTTGTGARNYLAGTGDHNFTGHVWLPGAASLNVGDSSDDPTFRLRKVGTGNGWVYWRSDTTDYHRFNFNTAERLKLQSLVSASWEDVIDTNPNGTITIGNTTAATALAYNAGAAGITGATGPGAPGTAQPGPIAGGDGGDETVTLGAGADGIGGAVGESSPAGAGGTIHRTAGKGGDGAAGTENGIAGAGGDHIIEAGVAGTPVTDAGSAAGGSAILRARESINPIAAGLHGVCVSEGPAGGAAADDPVHRFTNRGTGTGGGGSVDLFVDDSGTTPAQTANTGSLAFVNDGAADSQMFLNVGPGTGTSANWERVLVGTSLAGDFTFTDAAAIVAVGDGTGSPRYELHKSAGGTATIRFFSEETGQQRRFQIGINGSETISLAGYDTSGVLIENFLEYQPTTKEIRLGKDAETGDINIGTGAAARTITIGNTTGATAIELDAGTGGINANVPVTMASYTVAGVPTAVAGGVIYVTDETGGAVLAFSDGTNWRRCTDRAIVS